MKQFLHKILSSLLAIIVLFSTFSFSVESHFCGERLVDSSIFQKVKSCGVEMDKSLENESEINKKSCCRNEISVVEGKIVHKQELEKNKLEQVQFVTTFIVSYNNLFANNYKQNSSDLIYDPPLVHKDVVVLYENFRI